MGGISGLSHAQVHCSFYYSLNMVPLYHEMPLYCKQVNFCLACGALPTLSQAVCGEQGVTEECLQPAADRLDGPGHWQEVQERLRWGGRYQ